MKKSLIALLSIAVLMSSSFVNAETPTPTTSTTESTTTQSSTKQVENTSPQPNETIVDNGEQVETFPKDNMINDDMNDNTETNDGQNWLDLPNSDDWRYNGFEGHKSLTPPTKQEQTTTEGTSEGQNWLELPNSNEWRYNGFKGHESLTPTTTQSQEVNQPQPTTQETEPTAQLQQTQESVQPTTITKTNTTTQVPKTTQESTQQPQEVNEPTAKQIENATKEPSIFVMDTLPQTGNKDILGDILEVLGFALLIGIAVYISYSPIKRKLNNNKKN